MPNWKKVITSGSNADLNQITASAFQFIGSGDAELEVQGHITASGNISASGQLIAASADFKDGNITNVGVIDADSLRGDADTDVEITLGTSGFTFNAAAGDLFDFNSSAENTDFRVRGEGEDNVIYVDATADKLGIGTATPSKLLTVAGDISASGAINTLSHITASGNISSSGGFIGNLTGTADVATVATTVTITDNESTDEANAIVFTAGGDVDGGNLGLESDGTLNYNPSTGTVTATGFSGNLTGTLQTAAQTNITSVGALNAGSITSGFTSIDVGSGAITTTGTATLGTTLTTVNKFEKTGTTDAEGQGDVVYLGGTTSMDAGKIYHYKSDGTWELADADTAATSDGLLGVALGAASDTNGMLLRGMVTLDHDPGAVGDVLYLQNDTDGNPGEATSAIADDNNQVVRVIGYCLDASNGQIWFNPSSTFVEVSA